LENQISESNRAKESLKTSEERYRFLTENIKDVIWVFDPVGKNFSYVSPSVESLLGYTVDEMMAKSFDEVLALFSVGKNLEDIEIKLASYLQNPASLQLDPIEKKMIRKDGDLVWVETIASCRPNEETGYFQVIGVSREISARKQIEATLRKLSRAVEQSASAIMVTNKEGIIEFVNPAFEQITGYSQQEVAGKKPSILKSGHTSPETYKNLWETITQGQVWRGELLNRKKNQDLYWEYEIISPVRDSDGQITDYVAIKDDITARKQAEATMKRYTQSLEELKEKLHEQAIRDPLTGAFNRRFMMESLEREVGRANREGYPLSLVMMDIDHFKSVNDVYGHLAGDQVLKDLARFLEYETRKSDIVCRYGGEEFVVLMPKISVVDARRRAESWRAEFQVFKTAYGDSLISVTISMGIAVKEDPTLTCDGLISRADLALYSAKQAGRNNIVVWQEK
jgi:diguanylate cyclase (GGDEF)-like protein/PAS domain S-box-containing protein